MDKGTLSTAAGETWRAEQRASLEGMQRAGNIGVRRGQRYENAIQELRTERSGKGTES